MSDQRIALAVTLTLAALPAIGADIVLTPPAAGGVRITDATGNATRFLLKEDGTLDIGAQGSVSAQGVSFIRSLFSDNLFIGLGAGNSSLSGNFNIGLGYNVLRSTTTGRYNTAIGDGAMAGNTTGSDNIALGALALVANISGSANVALGRLALTANTAGDNVAIGAEALKSNTTGYSNIASGTGALSANISGRRNTAIGHEAMFSNTASDNIAVGTTALHANTTGTDNVAIGNGALAMTTTANNNTAVGNNALTKTTGFSNIALGDAAGVNVLEGNENIHIGHPGSNADTGTIRIGHTFTLKAFIGGIRGKTTGSANAIPVMVDSLGQLGTASSSARFKDDIADMGDGTSDLMKLRPVTFHYLADQDPAGRTLQYGLVAEEVAEVYPGLVARSNDGQVETVMYQFLPSMLLNEFQKQQRELAALRTELAEMKQMLRRQK